VRQNRELTKSVSPLPSLLPKGTLPHAVIRRLNPPQSKHDAIPPHPHPRTRDLPPPRRKPRAPLPDHRAAAPLPPAPDSRPRRPDRQEPAREHARGIGPVGGRAGRRVGCGPSAAGRRRRRRRRRIRCCGRRGGCEVAGSEELEEYAPSVGCGWWGAGPGPGTWARDGGEWEWEWEVASDCGGQVLSPADDEVCSFDLRSRIPVLALDA